MTKETFLNELVLRFVGVAMGLTYGPAHELLAAAAAEPWFAELGDDEQYEVTAYLADHRAAQAAARDARQAACKAAQDLLVPTRRHTRRRVR